MGVLVVVLVIGIVGAGHPGRGVPGDLIRGQSGGHAFLVVGRVIYLWSTNAAQARRFRDIGWGAVFVIPAGSAPASLGCAVMGAPRNAVLHGSQVSWPDCS